MKLQRSVLRDCLTWLRIFWLARVLHQMRVLLCNNSHFVSIIPGHDERKFYHTSESLRICFVADDMIHWMYCRQNNSNCDSAGVRDIPGRVGLHNNGTKTLSLMIDSVVFGTKYPWRCIGYLNRSCYYISEVRSTIYRHEFYFAQFHLMTIHRKLTCSL